MDIIEEIWRDVSGYENYLEVSNLGRIRRKGHPGTKKAYIEAKILTMQSGYIYTTIKGSPLSLSVAKLVADAFIPIPTGIENYIAVTVREKHNYCVDNIKWIDNEQLEKHKEERKKQLKKQTEKETEKKPRLSAKKNAIIQLRENGEIVRRYINVNEILSMHPTWQEDEILKCLSGDSTSAYGWRFISEAEYEKN